MDLRRDWFVTLLLFSHLTQQMVSSSLLNYTNLIFFPRLVIILRHCVNTNNVLQW